MTPNKAKDILWRLVTCYPKLMDEQAWDHYSGDEIREWIVNEIWNDEELKKLSKRGYPSDDRLEVLERGRVRYRDAARDLHAVEGEIEIDDDAERSRSDSGSYVQAWVLVPKEEVKS